MFQMLYSHVQHLRILQLEELQSTMAVQTQSQDWHLQQLMS